MFYYLYVLLSLCFIISMFYYLYVISMLLYNYLFCQFKIQHCILQRCVVQRCWINGTSANQVLQVGIQQFLNLAVVVVLIHNSIQGLKIQILMQKCNLFFSLCFFQQYISFNKLFYKFVYPPNKIGKLLKNKCLQINH